MIDLQEVIIRFRENTFDRTVTLTKVQNVGGDMDRISWRIGAISGYTSISGQSETIPNEVLECLLAVFAIQQ